MSFVNELKFFLRFRRQIKAARILRNTRTTGQTTNVGTANTLEKFRFVPASPFVQSDSAELHDRVWITDKREVTIRL